MPWEAPRPLSGVPRPGAFGPRSRCPHGASRRGAESSRLPLTAPGRAYCGDGGWDNPGARARARGERSVALARAALGSLCRPAGAAGRQRSWGRLAPGGRACGRARPRGRGAVGWGLSASSPKPWALGGLLRADPACGVVNWLWVCCRVEGVVAAETALLARLMAISVLALRARGKVV